MLQRQGLFMLVYLTNTDVKESLALLWSRTDRLGFFIAHVLHPQTALVLSWLKLKWPFCHILSLHLTSEAAGSQEQGAEWGGYFGQGCFRGASWSWELKPRLPDCKTNALTTRLPAEMHNSFIWSPTLFKSHLSSTMDDKIACKIASLLLGAPVVGGLGQLWSVMDMQLSQHLPNHWVFDLSDIWTTECLFNCHC